jgi:hypothetical protein
MSKDAASKVAGYNLDDWGLIRGQVGIYLFASRLVLGPLNHLPDEYQGLFS